METESIGCGVDGDGVDGDGVDGDGVDGDGASMAMAMAS
jgi:hypothetical protein